MIHYKKAETKDIPELMEIRLEMLQDVNDLPPNYIFSKELIQKSKEYFESSNQTTILAFDDDIVGCATMCYIEVMPTFSHPRGLRGHLMNVYTKMKYRRQGIARQMLNLLIEEARKKGITEITLDATEAGRPLYRECGFTESNECMVLNL